MGITIITGGKFCNPPPPAGSTVCCLYFHLFCAIILFAKYLSFFQFLHSLFSVRKDILDLILEKATEKVLEFAFKSHFKLSKKNVLLIFVSPCIYLQLRTHFLLIRAYE